MHIILFILLIVYVSFYFIPYVPVVMSTCMTVCVYKYDGVCQQVWHCASVSMMSYFPCAGSSMSKEYKSEQFYNFGGIYLLIENLF